MKKKRLPIVKERLALELIESFDKQLREVFGAPNIKRSKLSVWYSEDGPKLNFRSDHTDFILGPNAMTYEPTFVANVAHESVHLFQGTKGYASGLEEGFAVAFELSTIESRYGRIERVNFLNALPSAYEQCYSDYLKFTSQGKHTAFAVYETFGSLTGFTSRQLRCSYPKVGFLLSLRLARQHRMRD